MNISTSIFYSAKSILLFFFILINKDSIAHSEIDKKYQYILSEEGAISDANILEGSTNFGTDNTAVIQRVLDRALDHPITIYWDGKYAVTGLKIHSNTSIIACEQCGAILRNNSNTSLLENSNMSFEQFTTRNISIVGGVWNGNGYNDEFNPAQAHDLPNQGWISAFRFFGVENITIRDATIYRPRTFTLHAAKIKDFFIQNVKVDVGEKAPINCDGFHFNGPAENITIKDCNIRAKDDHIAFNADDLLDEHAHNKGNFHDGIYGDIKNIIIENTRFEHGLFGIRLLSGRNRIDNVIVRNIQGVTKGYWLIVDTYWQQPLGPGNFGNLFFENIMVESTQGGNVLGNYINSAYANINANVENIVFKNIFRTNFVEDDFPTILVSGSGTVVNRMRIEGYDTRKSSKWSAENTPHIVVRDAKIESISIVNSIVENENQNTYSSLLKLTEKSVIDRLQIMTVQGIKVKHLVESFGKINQLQAVNIIHDSENKIDESFKLNQDVKLFVLSNYSGRKPLGGRGKIAKKKGYDFD